MKLFFKSKDGGPDSNVTGYWLIEWKRVFSIVLLRFDEGSREAFHNHAFNAWSWVLAGRLQEVVIDTAEACVIGVNEMQASFKPIHTARDRMHKVYGKAKRTWVLSFRGPWTKNWKEYFADTNSEVTLTHGRKVVE